MKRFAKTIFIAALLVVLAGSSFLLQPGLAQTPSPTAPEPTAAPPTGQPDIPPAEMPLRTITVSGVGQAQVQPDVVVVRLGVRTEAPDASQALTQNSQQMQALLNVLDDAGIQQNDIQTQTVQLFPQYQDRPDPESNQLQIRGYMATNIVQVRVRDIDDLGELLDASVQAGGNTIEGISFEVSDAAEAMDQAREAAMNDARHKAQQLASLAGASVGQVISISESSPIPYPIDIGRGGMAVAEDAAVPIQPGSQQTQVTVHVTWLLTGGTGLPDTGDQAQATATPQPQSTATPQTQVTATPGAQNTATPQGQTATATPQGGLTATPQAMVTISPITGPAGTRVLVQASGFPANARVTIGAGRTETNLFILDTARTDANGQLSLEVTLPANAEPGQRWVFVVDGDAAQAASNVFTVTR